jgi:putative heme-binding domain-containing protein
LFRIAAPKLFVAALTFVLGHGLEPTSLAAQSKAKKPAVKQPPAQPDELIVAPGFKVELLHVAEPATEGSWINMCKEPNGCLLVSGQQGEPILRFTVKDGKVASVEPLKLPISISQAMGMLYAFESLYLNANGPNGFGLYRFRDTNDDGQYDQVAFLKRFEGPGDHGPHAVVLGPDNMLYIVNGNQTKLPEGLAPTSPHRNYREDHLLPRQWDSTGSQLGILAPGGHVLRTDAEGKKWELVLAGFRNAYDIAFNGDGEMFTFDSDTERDWGMPWYRPIRVNHCVSAAEFGWRAGTANWPAYFADSLPAVVDVGIGSPTGVTFGTGARFPAKYQKAFFALDWTYGRLLAVEMTPHGASYKATYSNFVAPLGLVKSDAPKKPLNLTDVVIGDDGAMYFIIGGRSTQSALYRVVYTGPEPTAPTDLKDKNGAEARALRHKLEEFHGKVDPRAVETAWRHLGSDDRFIRWAARVAVEFQPVTEWQARAVAEKDRAAALTALLALARYGDRSTQADLCTALAKFRLDQLSDEQKLDKLRVLQLSRIRQGRPNDSLVREVIAELDPQFPGSNVLVNREIFQVLVNLQAPGIVAKALEQMAGAKTQEDRMHYLFHLRTLPVGAWTLDQRKEYLSYWGKDCKKLPTPPRMLAWFEEAGRAYADGSSFNNFLKNFLQEAVANMAPAELKELDHLIASINKDVTPIYDIKPRSLVKIWKTEDILPQLDKVSRGRNFEKGREAYLAGQCIKCHRFGDLGGSVGPDLTAISSRFGRKEILESIIEPSKVVSDQYQNEIINTFSGKTITGRVVDETKATIAVQPDALAPERVVIRKDDFEMRKRSPLSPMPANLADVLTADEILDLLAYLESAGRKNHPVFQKK